MPAGQSVWSDMMNPTNDRQLTHGSGPIRALQGLYANTASFSAREKMVNALSGLMPLLERPAEPIRVIQHLACTGGTLFSRCLQAQPNTTVLSELDPISTIQLKTQRSGFAPTDPILLARAGLNRIDDETAVEMFLAAVGVLRARLERTGRRLVLRGHAHSQFCTEVNWNLRPTLNEMLGGLAPVRSVVTVRHPIESFASLNHNKWHHFSPFCLDEYCLRYLAFLDRHAEIPSLRYEMLVSDPDATIRMLCDILELPFNVDWPMLIPAIRMTGDSGRRGNVIVPRPRREISGYLVEEAAQSENYHTLCERLGYDPSTA